MSENHPMFDAQNNVFEKDQELKSYFDSLAPVVQEAVFQSGVPIQSVEQLRKFEKEYTGK